jgi:hypothetical protein
MGHSNLLYAPVRHASVHGAWSGMLSGRGATTVCITTMRKSLETAGRIARTARVTAAAGATQHSGGVIYRFDHLRQDSALGAAMFDLDTIVA